MTINNNTIFEHHSSGKEERAFEHRMGRDAKISPIGLDSIKDLFV